MKVKSIVPTKGTSWTLFTGEELPERAVKFVQGMNGFKYGGSWLIGTVFYRGDLTDTNDWIVVTEDGGFYKVDAIFMVWASVGDKKTSQAIWSVAALKRTLKSLLLFGVTTSDPDYQT